MLLIRDGDLDARRAIANGPLAALSQSLQDELEPLFARELYIPRAKALLSRAGGRCEHDGTLLEFDPFSPELHRCPRCGSVFTGELHHRAWVYPYQLWLAERALQASLFALLNKSNRHSRLAQNILLEYSRLYLEYPNEDNVLGPTRLFFSTYLESIWLLQICIAADFLRASGDARTADMVRDNIVQPSMDVIAQYDEGRSNRQVWNDAALLAASLFLGDRERAESIVKSVSSHLRSELLSDGSWYEGENYHLFAHRGLWYSVTMAEVAGLHVAPELIARFNEGFAVPFATALPDLTLPARKDSQYAISVRQPRFAELCELGLARTDDRRLSSMLARLYDGSTPRTDTGRLRSTADVERNLPASSLTRADLGWRGLIAARAALPPLEPTPPRSAHLEGQGVTIFRRDEGRVYIAMDWGQSGGGHGHPDRLNLLFSHDDTRWLDDLGTGSYVDPSLHWYRSTLAHNAPLIDGKSQLRVDGRVVAYDERLGVGWLHAQVSGVAPGVTVDRTVIVTPDYFIDEITCHAERVVRFELPMHFRGEPDLDLTPAVLDGGTGIEDGFAFATNAACAAVAKNSAVHLAAHSARAWVQANREATWFSADAPGQPAAQTRRFHVVRTHGSTGTIRSVWTWTSRVDSVAFADDTISVTLGAEHHEHKRTPDYWSMEMRVSGAQSGIELFGFRKASATTENRAASAATPEPISLTRHGPALTVQLGEEHYRRSEQTWRDAGRPTASISFKATEGDIELTVRVHTTGIVHVDADAINPYDNEHPEVNAHSVQVYILAANGGGAWSIVPEREEGPARVRKLDGWGNMMPSAAEWSRTSEGYEIRATIPNMPGTSIDIIVNDVTASRTRRRGQLVLSGGRQEFVYLRGDRHDADRLIPIRVE